MEENLEWTVQTLVNYIKEATEEKSENGIYCKSMFFTKTFMESIEEVIRDYKLKIDR